MTAVAGVLLSAGLVEAAWVTIKNDSHQAIVLQETMEVNGQFKRGKPRKLLPGESVREYIPGPKVKTIDVFDGKNPDRHLATGSLDCKDETQSFSIQTAGGKVRFKKELETTRK